MTLRWGILGCGDVARRRVAEAIRGAEGSRLTAACRRDPEALAAFCRSYDVPRAYVDAGGCDGLVPGASTIVGLWEDTLDKLAQRDFDRLAPRLDWVLKRQQFSRSELANAFPDRSAQALDKLLTDLGTMRLTEIV